jgi:hypothetical protein
MMRLFSHENMIGGTNDSAKKLRTHAGSYTGELNAGQQLLMGALFLKTYGVPLPKALKYAAMHIARPKRVLVV